MHPCRWMHLFCFAHLVQPRSALASPLRPLAHASPASCTPRRRRRRSQGAGALPLCLRPRRRRHGVVRARWRARPIGAVVYVQQGIWARCLHGLLGWRGACRWVGPRPGHCSIAELATTGRRYADAAGISAHLSCSVDRGVPDPLAAAAAWPCIVNSLDVSPRDPDLLAFGHRSSTPATTVSPKEK